jgi:hypothetical protein
MKSNGVHNVTKYYGETINASKETEQKKMVHYAGLTLKIDILRVHYFDCK